MPDNIVDLKVGIGADISQLVTDLKDAEKKIAALGSEPVKITITPELDVKSFVSQIQKAVGKQATKVSVGSAESKGASTAKPKIDITDATGQLAILERRMEEIKKVAGNIDVGHKINVDPKGDITGAVIRYTNALGQAVSESYKLIETFDDAGEVIDREFKAMGETMSDSTTKVARFKESIRGVEIALESFATKNADIGDQIGLKELISDFDVLKNDTNAEVVALQRFKNEFNAVKVKADEMRAAQKAQARDSKDEERITSLQRQLDLQQAIKAIRSGDVEEMQRQLVLLGQMERLVRKDLDDSDVSVQLQAQRQINEIYKQREQIVAANAAHEKQTSNEKAAIERQTAAGQREAAREKAAIERQSLRDQTSFQQTINQLKSVSSSSLVNEQQKITDLYKKQLEYINRRIATEKALNTSGSKQARIALQYQKATLRTVTYKAKLATYAKDVADQITRAKNNMSGLQGYSRSTANIFKGIILSQTFYNAVGFLRNLVNEAWELSVALNTSEAVFTGMLTGGQERARGLLEVLKQEAINTPFDINNLLQATRLLTAYGIQAKNLMYVMRAVEKATAVSGDPVRMEYISRAIGQIYTKGKLQAEEVRQLTESGIAVGEILADELNLTQEQIAQGWGKLNIDANTAINAIVRGIDKRYGQALDNMARTTEQKLNNMKESFALITSSMTDPIRRGIDTVIDIITPKIEQLYQAIQAVGLGNALKSLIPKRLYDGAITAINKIVGAVQALKIMFQQLKPVIDVVLGALAWRMQLAYNIFITVVSVIGMIGNALSGSARGLSYLESGLKTVLGLMLAYKAAMFVIAAVSKVWSIVSVVVRGVIVAVQGVIVAMQGMAAVMSAAGLAGASGFLPVIGVLLTIIGLVAALSGSLGSVVDAAKRVGDALKNMGGGTTLGGMFEDVSSSMQSSIDAYNAEVAKQNAAMSNALIENSGDQTDAAEDAGSATEKAMKGLMSFDEVYKLNEPSTGGGGGGTGPLPVEIEGFALPAVGGVFDAVGGIGEGLFDDLNLGELQDALGGLWAEIRPLLDDVLLYVLKMVGYFAEMHFMSKLMTSENKEQWTLEKDQTSEDTEQKRQEELQTSQDTEQKRQEELQTSQDEEQRRQEELQTSQDTEQKRQEELQTAEDTEQKRQEELQTAQDTEQKRQEELQTAQDTEQKRQEELQTAQDTEQKRQEELQTAQDTEQKRQEELQTAQDTEQKRQEELQTAQDTEQKRQEELQTLQDTEQKRQESLQTAEDKEQLANEKLSTAEDKEQYTLTRTRGTGTGTGGAGVAGAASALALINVAQIGASAKMIIDDIKNLSDGTADLSEWMSLFVNGLMMAVDVLQLFGAFKLIKGALGGAAAAGAGAAVAGGTGTAALSGTATTAGAAVGGLGAAALGVVGVTAILSQIIRKAAEDSDTAYNNLRKYNEYKDATLGLSRDRATLLEEEKTLVALLAQAEAEQAEAKARLDKTGNAIDYATHEERKARTEEIRALLEQNSHDIENYSDAVVGHGESTVESLQAAANAMAEKLKADKELLATQQDAYRQYYLDVENLTKTYHSNLNAISAEGYAQSDTTMEDWLTGMTKRQEQEYQVQENLARLKGRDIPAGMLEELTAAGPQYSALIGELADANDADLDEVVKVWEENAALARKMALDELGPMPDDARDLLKRYRGATDEELEKLVDSYATQHKISREEAVKELSALTGDTESVIKETVDYVEGKGSRDYKEAFKAMGLRAPEGLRDKKKDAIDASGEIADAVVDEADKRKSSMKGVGDDTGEAYSKGVKDNKKGSGEAGDELAQSAIDSAKSTAIISAWVKAGSDSYKSYVGGLEIGHTKASDAGKELADKAKSGAETVSMYSSGSEAGQTFINGISSKSTAIGNAFKTVLNGLLGSMEMFTGRVAIALNTTLSGFASTMSSMSVSSTGKVSYTRMSGSKVSAMADGGIIHRAARGIQLLRKPTMLASNAMGGEAGAEVVFPLENTPFIKAFAEKIANEVSSSNMQVAAQNLNSQMRQARAGAAQSITLSAASAEDISNAIRSWFTPQMQSLHDVLEEDRTVEVTVPHTSNALWRSILSELKAVNESAGSRGLSVVGR